MVKESYRKVTRKSVPKPFSARFCESYDLGKKAVKKHRMENRGELGGRCINDKQIEIISNWYTLSKDRMKGTGLRGLSLVREQKSRPVGFVARGTTLHLLGEIMKDLAEIFNNYEY